jgi:hypothetical protein
VLAGVEQELFECARRSREPDPIKRGAGARACAAARMAQVKVFCEPEREFLTVFWQEPRPGQVCTELDDGVVLIKDEVTGEPIGLELLSCRPGEARFDSVNVEVGTSAAR